MRIVDLDALRRNFLALRAVVPSNARMLAVLKSDAYGHGLTQAAHALASVGADMFGVAIADEGVALRESGIDTPVLILGPVMGDALEAAVAHDLTATVCSPDMVQQLQCAAMKTGRTAAAHLKLDTGMRRIGCRDMAQVSAVLDALEHAPDVRLTGVFSHLADADGDDPAFTQAQLALFRSMTDALPCGVTRHVANSAASLRLMPGAAYDMVREGIALYGYPPVDSPVPLDMCMSWETAVTFVKDITPSDCVGYGCTFTADRPMRVATVACGYGDGYHRAASGRAEVLIQGQRCRVLGRICMDQLMADVTHVPQAAPGDRVVLMGTMGAERITAADIAAWADTIPYEILLAATGRVRRVWHGGL